MARNLFVLSALSLTLVGCFGPDKAPSPVSDGAPSFGGPTLVDNGGLNGGLVPTAPAPAAAPATKPATKAPTKKAPGTKLPIEKAGNK